MYLSASQLQIHPFFRLAFPVHIQRMLILGQHLHFACHILLCYMLERPVKMSIPNFSFFGVSMIICLSTIHNHSSNILVFPTHKIAGGFLTLSPPLQLCGALLELGILRGSSQFHFLSFMH